MASCCPPLYWCTYAGAVAVEAVGGEYTIPAGAVSGPYVTEADATGVCPPAFTSTCDDPPVEYTFSEEINFSYVNPTGCFAANAVTAAVSPLDAGLCCGASTGGVGPTTIGPACPGDADPVTVVATFTWCRGRTPPYGPAQMIQELQLTVAWGFTPPAFTYTVTASGVDGWTDDPPTSVYRTISGVDQRIMAPTFVATIELFDGSMVSLGTVQVYVS